MLSGAAAPLPAAAQVDVQADVEIATDQRRRGLSWSGGALAPAAGVRVELPTGLDLGARLTATRGDPRHGGADAVVDPSLGWRVQAGAVRLDAFATAHLFARARAALDYGELGAAAAYSLGPAEAAVEARYAPSQAGIGGDNLYLRAGLAAGIPATPFTLTAAVGRSSGHADDPVRAARLRPGGRYHDWSIGVERVSGPLTLALLYTGTDIARRPANGESSYARRRHAGDRISARVSFGF